MRKFLLLLPLLSLLALNGNDGGDGGDGGEGGDGGSGGAGGSGSERGFPENTPLDQMTVEQREAYWKHQSRKHEGRLKERSDYEELKAKAAKLEEIEAANATEQEKAVKAARDEAAAGAAKAERDRLAPVLVSTHVEAAVTGGKLTQDQAEALLEGLDATKYLNDDGTVDTAKVTALIDKLAPANGTPSVLNTGQGKRGSNGKPSGKEAGLAEAERRGWVTSGT